MTAAVSAIPALALLLAAWTTLSLLAVPTLVRATRSQAGTNARLARTLERRAWAARRR